MSCTLYVTANYIKQYFICNERRYKIIKDMY